MDYNNRLQFEDDVEQMLKPVLKTLYMKYNTYDSVIIHQEFLNYVFKRTHAKILKYANSKKHRRLRFKQLKCELNELSVKKQLENYVEEL